MNVFQTWLCAIRPKTLSASVAPILLSQVLVYPLTANFSFTLALVILLCALLLQISVNLANDYFDDIAGVDSDQRLGPIKTIQAGLLTRQQIKQAMLATLIVAVFVGSYLVYVGGFIFFVLGLLCIGAVLGYSAGPKPLASIALGELTVLIFFGPLAIFASMYLQLQGQAILADFISATPYALQMGLLSAAIMLVNNIRDIDTDIQAKKHTLAVYLKPNYSRLLYACIVMSIPVIAYVNLQSDWLVALGFILASILSLSLFKRSAKQLNQQLAQTAAFTMCWSILCCIEFML